MMGADEYPYTYAEALEMMTSHLRDFKEEELQHLKEIGAADWIYIDGEVHFQRLFYDNLDTDASRSGRSCDCTE